MKITFKNNEGIEYKVIIRKIRPGDSKGMRPKNIEGYCENPNKKNPKIVIDETVDNQRLIEVIAEEYLHAHVWDLPECKVRRFASNLTKILYKLDLIKK